MSAYVNLTGPMVPTEGVPPVLPPDPTVPRAGWIRRLAMLVLLMSYLLAILFRRGPVAGDGPALPDTTGEMLSMLALDLGFFAVLFAIACVLGRPRRTDLYVNHGPTPARWFFGFLWSLALRFGLGALLAGVAIVMQLFQKTADPAALEQFQPKIQNLLRLGALKDPVYLLAVCTVVSFVVAGLREELWRAGMIFALASLLPAGWSKRSREVLAVAFAAVIFGLGHLTQGFGGVVLTGVLGLLLGLIMVLRSSLWEAVIAHGFFDASTFLMLRVILDRSLMEDWLTRAGVPPDAYKPILDELAKRLSP